MTKRPLSPLRPWSFASLGLVLVSLVTSSVFGNFQPNLDDHYSLRLAYYDNPASLRVWSAAQLQQLHSDQEPVRWVRAVWAQAMSVPKWSDIPDAKNLFLKASRIAEQHGMTYEMIHFLDYAVDVDNQSQDPGSHRSPSEKKSHYQELIRQADQRGDQVTAFKMALYYADYLTGLGELGAASSIIRQYSENIAKYPDLKPIDHAVLKQALANNLLEQGEQSPALQIFHDIEEFCKAYPLRSFCANNLVQLGYIEAEQKHDESITRAQAYFSGALKMGLESGHGWVVSFARAGLCEMSLLRQQYAEALILANHTIQDRLKIDDRNLLARGYILRARAKTGLASYQDALDDLKTVKKLMSADANDLLSEVELLSATIHKNLGRPWEALTALENYNKLYGAIVDDKEKSEFAKQSARIGLIAEEERSKFLAKENELKQQKIQAQEKARYVTTWLLLLSALIIAVLLLAIFRSIEIKKTKEAMKRVLDHIEEAILTIDRDLRIESHHSHYLLTILDNKNIVSGMDALDVMFASSHLSAEQRSIIREALGACLGEEQIAWDLNASHLPQEITLLLPDRTPIIDVVWQPIFDRFHRLQRVLVILRDVTLRKSLESEVASMRINNGQLTRKMSELVSANGEAVAPLLGKASQLAAMIQSSPSPDSSRILRDLHSIKGIARTVGLSSLSEATHDLESSLVSDPEQKLSHSGMWQPWLQGISQYEDLLNKFSQFAAAKGPSRPGSALPFSLYRMAAEQNDTLRQTLAQKQLRLKGVFIRDDIQGWPAAFVQAARETVMHALNNSIDHGFVFPRDRGEAIDSVEIHLEASIESDNLVMTILDNGAGINWEAIRLKALQKGLPSQNMDDLSQFLFMDQVTTAPQLSLTSGRGVGLAAIKHLAEAWGGSCRIDNRHDARGACLRLTIPMDRLQVPAPLSKSA
ncbi:MAG TPA: ATP-binding protein [Oligoflexus sp.]|uniref:ATP-binding protein n=1 Tax=Oligoflexus sp. TaxID=1971216 RepID=UPI002D6711D3|nr:ATP-binding protein [Oligoflexus sp.]HYX36260.1 ATP-binding protein [Oligoflexus sp.]